MTTDSTRDKPMEDYRQSLIRALRLKDVPGDRIGEIVAEVESHVGDTGEDPVDAFGAPKDYAAVLTEGESREPWWRMAIIAVPAFVGGWFVAQGALHVLLGETYRGQSGWLWLALGLIAAIPPVVMLRRSSSRVRDPRTGADMVPTSGWAIAAVVACPMVPILVAWVVIEISN